MAKILLKGGQVADSTGTYDANVLLQDDKIEGIYDLDSRPQADQIIDCEGKLILPGFIDVHVHLREPGQDYKEDWESGSSAAVAGGVTTVLDMPNNQPPILSSAELEAKRRLVQNRSYCNYGFYIAFDGKNLDEVNSSDAVAVKFYSANSTGDIGVEDKKAIENFFEYANKLIVVHAEDEALIKENHKLYFGNSVDQEKNLKNAFLHSRIRSPECAEKSVQEFCDLAKRFRSKLHIAHLSTERELEILKDYPQVTCEVAPHHLFLCEDDYGDLKNFIKINPPVRGRTDVFALWKAIKFGEVDILATDHAPHTQKEKQENYLKAPSGVPELDTFAPLVFNSVNDEGLTIAEVVRLCCEKPAEIFGLKNKGKIEAGFDADVIVVDMDLEKKVKNEDLFTKCGWSPYENMLLKGWPIKTFVNGELVFEGGKIVGEKVGKECVR
jgi:dihydroorotase